MATIDLVSKELEATLNKPGIVLIDCWAPWCAPCRMFGPIFERASNKHPDITFAKVNVDEEPAIGQVFGVQSIPTLLVFRDGIGLAEQVGALPEKALEQLIEQVKALDMDEVRKKVAELTEAEQKKAAAAGARR